MYFPRVFKTVFLAVRTADIPRKTSFFSIVPPGYPSLFAGLSGYFPRNREKLVRPTITLCLDRVFRVRFECSRERIRTYRVTPFAGRAHVNYTTSNIRLEIVLLRICRDSFRSEITYTSPGAAMTSRGIFNCNYRFSET